MLLIPRQDLSSHTARSSPCPRPILDNFNMVTKGNQRCEGGPASQKGNFDLAGGNTEGHIPVLCPFQERAKGWPARNAGGEPPHSR